MATKSAKAEPPRVYAVKIPKQLADAFDRWRNERGVNTNKALKALIVAELRSAQRDGAAA